MGFGSGDEAYKGKFNQLIVDWDVSEVTDMESMFEYAERFNQSLDGWNVSQVTDMKYMLKDATSFNQCLSTWGMKTSDGVDTKEMLKGTACPDCTDAACFSPIGVGPWCQKEDVCSTGSQSPSSPPSDSPPDDDCKGDKDKIVLEKKGSQKCEKIFEKGWCGKNVVGGGGDTAKKFCTICGCGEDPVPTPSPPDDDCKGGDDKIDLKNGGEQKCKNIFKDGLCEEKVQGGGKAKNFCTSCGCGEDSVPTPSPPDDDCKGGDDKIDLKNGG